MIENKDFYVIELKSKIKVGITISFKKRFSNIKTGSGIKDNEIINVFHYPDLSFLEARIKRLFSKQKIAGEWFYKKGIVLDFIDGLKDGNIPTVDFLKELQNDSVKYSNVFKAEDYIYEDFKDLKDDAVNLLEQIKSERKDIGYPDSIDLAKFMRVKRANYRNMVYHVDEDFKYFDRKPNFCIEEIKDNQIIECLRIIKNTTANNKIKMQLQNQIDSIFSKSNIYRDEVIELIKSYFFEKNYKEDTEIVYFNIKMEYDKELNMYSIGNFEDLNKDEMLFLRGAKNQNLEVTIFGNINFDYKNRYCSCYFNIENYLRVLNFLSITKIEEDGIRLYLNDTHEFHKNYIFQYKYHLLNSSEKEFINSLKISGHSDDYIEFEKDGKIYYCLFDDIEIICKDLGIDKNRKETIKVFAEPF